MYFCSAAHLFPALDRQQVCLGWALLYPVNPSAWSTLLIARCANETFPLRTWTLLVLCTGCNQYSSCKTYFTGMTLSVGVMEENKGFIHYLLISVTVVMLRSLDEEGWTQRTSVGPFFKMFFKKEARTLRFGLNRVWIMVALVCEFLYLICVSCCLHCRKTLYS